MAENVQKMCRKAQLKLQKCANSVYIAHLSLVDLNQIDNFYYLK